MEIKRKDTQDKLITIKDVPIGSIFKLPRGKTNELYLRTAKGHIRLNCGYTYESDDMTRTDECAQVLKATLTVEE